jgi:hypothetical protein
LITPRKDDHPAIGDHPRPQIRGTQPANEVGRTNAPWVPEASVQSISRIVTSCCMRYVQRLETRGENTEVRSQESE